MPRDAEEWLAERGVRREGIRIPPSAPADQVPASAPAPDPGPGPEVSARDAARVASQAAADAELREADAAATPDPDPGEGRLEDDVAEAVAFVRRSTAGAPQSEGRVRDKLAERGWPRGVIEQTMQRARRERLVDDPAMAAALVEERRRKGHAPSKIRKDLRERGFDDATLDDALGSAEGQDLEAAAFDVANEKASRCGTLSAEAAYRRVVGHVVRRGYPEGLARKVAREAVFSARDQERAAGH